MGIVKKGIAKGISGKVGDFVFSQQKDGTTTVSEVQDFSDRVFSMRQLAAQAVTTLCSHFIKPIKSFLEIGYALDAENFNFNCNNAMASHLRNAAIIGEYPDLKIDFAKVLVTKGSLPPPKDVTIKVNENGLAFTWNPAIVDGDGTHYSDQIIMLAYFPELEKVRYTAGGAQRFTGKDLLMLTGMEKGNLAEIYISFITDNRKEISNSVHLGQINW